MCKHCKLSKALAEQQKKKLFNFYPTYSKYKHA